MRFLTLREIPIILGENDNKKHPVPVFGASIARADLVKALFRYGTYDRYYFLLRSPAQLEEAKYRLSFYPDHQRAELILLDDYAKLRHLDQMALLAGQASLQELAHFRRCHGRATWPVTGITMTLSYNGAVVKVMETLLQELYSHDALICISHAGRRVVENMIQHVCDFLYRKFRVSVSYPGQLPVIPLGVDAELFKPREQLKARLRFSIPLDAIVLLYVGRFSTRFKMDLFPLILAFAEWARGKDQIKLILAGDDSESNLAAELKVFATAHGVADKVVLMPNLKAEDKHWLYSAADIFVSLSDNVQETLGISVIEAMAAGLPTIVSDWDGYRDTVQHGITGFRVPTYFADCVEQVGRFAMLRGNHETHELLGQSVAVDLKALVGYLDVLTENAGLRRQMGAQGRERVLRNYDWPVIIRQYEELWNELMMRAQTRHDLQEVEFEHGLNSYNYLKIFQHYPTSIITLDSRVRVTELGRKYLRGGLKIAPLEQNYWPDAEFIGEMIAACEAQQTIKIGALIKEVKNAPAAATEGWFYYITRLIKYGLLELELG